MNETFSRRNILNVLGAAFAGIGSAIMFRKFRGTTPSLSDTPRVLEDNSSTAGIELQSSNKFSPFLILDEEPEMLAHPTREEDDKILFDSEEDESFKEDISNRLGEAIFDEEGYQIGRKQGELTDEEYAAYQRYIKDDYSDDYSDTETSTSTSDSGTGGTVEGLAVPRITDAEMKELLPAFITSTCL